MAGPYQGPFLQNRIKPPLVVGPVGPTFRQPHTPIAPGVGGGLEGFLAGLGGPISLALPALQSLAGAAQGGPSNAAAFGLFDTDFGDTLTTTSTPFSTGAFAVGDNPSAGGTSLTSPVDTRGSERTGGAEGRFDGASPTQVGPVSPGAPVSSPGGFTGFPFSTGDGGRDDTLIYAALAGVAVLVLVMGMRK